MVFIRGLLGQKKVLCNFLSKNVYSNKEGVITIIKNRTVLTILKFLESCCPSE